MSFPVAITRIQETKRGRYSLFCEEEFLFSVDGETLLKNHVEVGDLFGEGELEALRLQSDERRAKDKALVFLSLRDHGFVELLRKLERTFDSDTALAAVRAMEELGLVNDEAFAAHRAKYLMETQGRSVREASMKMRELGLSKELVEEALLPYAETGGENAAALLIKKYAQKLRAGETQKVLAALQRRGYTYREAKEALLLAADELQIQEDDDEVF